MTAFSVIMTVFNVQQYVEKAVLSILKQTYDDFELIIVNDGSSDESMLVVEKLARKDPRIKIIDQENKGVAAARNNGLRVACGEYVGFVDSDDEVNENLLSVTRKNIEERHPDVLMSGVYMEKIGSNEEVERAYALKMPRSNYNREDLKHFTINDTSSEMLGYVTNKMYKRSFLKNNDIFFDEEILFLEDIEFNEKVLKVIGTLQIIDDCFYHYKFRKRKTLINTYRTKHFEHQLEAIRSRKEIFEKWNIEQSQIDSAVAGSHMLAIRATCSLLFKHTNDLTYKEKYEYISWILNHPLTIARIRHYDTLTVIDRILKRVVERRQVYTLAAISSVYGFHYKHFS